VLVARLLQPQLPQFRLQLRQHLLLPFLQIHPLPSNAS
jgi:hypothetical protein